MHIASALREEGREKIFTEESRVVLWGRIAAEGADGEAEVRRGKEELLCRYTRAAFASDSVDGPAERATEISRDRVHKRWWGPGGGGGRGVALCTEFVGVEGKKDTRWRAVVAEGAESRRGIVVRALGYPARY